MNVCKKDYKNSVPIGPGGIHCPCCAPRVNLKESRIAINRAFRRKDKIKLSKELKNTDEQ